MKKILLIIAVLLMALPVRAEGSELTRRIQSQYDSLSGFSADFIQQLKNAASGEIQTREGSISFKQPSLIRWETIHPEPELLIVGRDAVWDYFPEEQTVIKYPLSHVLNSKTMIRFLSGKARLEEDFVVEEQGVEMGLKKLMLTPLKPEPSLVQAYVWVDPADHLIKSILLLDFYGNANRLGLDNVVLNPEFPDDLFEFVPPDDVLIEDNTNQP